MIYESLRKKDSSVMDYSVTFEEKNQKQDLSDEVDWVSIKMLIETLESFESKIGQQLELKGKLSSLSETDYECLQNALGGHIFGIVTDTASKISNFASTAHHDNSYHVQKTRMALYPSFYHIATLDTFMIADTEPDILKKWIWWFG
ncbi:11363_t:CDS:2 [Entrophospora sp. SA101]|nr:11363_t:CDS:2 [Entrophospora sp. SA101]